MATLESQYRNYLLDNPNSQISFENWKTDILMPPIKVVLKDIDKKLKQDFLRAKGWSTVWHDDNWVDNRNPDLAGTTLDKAYQYAKENLDLYM